MKWYNFTREVKKDLTTYKSDEDPMDIWSAIEGRVDVLNESKKKKDKDLGLLLCFFMLFIFSVIYSTVDKQPVIEGEFMASSISDADLKTLDDPKELDIKNVEYSDDIIKEESTLSTNINTSNGLLKKDQSFGSEQAVPKQFPSYRNELSTLPSNSSIAEGNFSSPIMKEDKKTGGDQTSLGENTTNQGIKQIDNILFSNHRIESLKTPSLNLSPFSWAKKIEPSFYAFEKIELPKPAKFQLTVYGGVFYTKKELKKPSPWAFELLPIREASERSLESANLGLNLNYNLGRGFGISTGLDFLQINEEFIFTDTDSNFKYIEGVTHYVSNVARETQEVIGQVKETSTEYVDHISYNKYRLIDVPLMLSYTLNSGKWMLRLNAGIYANLTLQAQGRVAVNEFQSRPIEKAEMLRKNVGISYGTKIEFQRKLGKHLSLNVAPTFRYNPNSFTYGEYGLEQKYSFLGLNAGLSYNF